jgi:hypothetical protein
VGLTLVRSLVQMHGGTVEAQSAGPGKGSEFVVRLPLGGAPAVPSASDGAATRAVAVVPRRILVVDDNRDQAESLAMLLRVMGHEARVAVDGPGALVAAAEFGPEVLLVDIGLPGMNGYEVARRVREQPRCRAVVPAAPPGGGPAHPRRRSPRCRRADTALSGRRVQNPPGTPDGVSPSTLILSTTLQTRSPADLRHGGASGAGPSSATARDSPRRLLGWPSCVQGKNWPCRMGGMDGCTC